MAVIQRAAKLQSDAPPLWLPRHDAEVIEQSSARPPDSVDGYSLQDRLATLFLGSTWKMATMVSTAAAVVLFFALLPSLFGAGIGALLKLAIYQAWTLGLLLFATSRVRTISTGTAARYWLAGVFTVAMASYMINDVVAGLVSPSSVWITPILEELLKAAPLVVAIALGRRAWRHPGLSDLLILGFAVGAGYGFHEEALWERSATAGFGFDLGIFVPSVMNQNGELIVGQGVWTALVGLGIGLLILHRRHPAAAVGAVLALVVVIADHMSVNDPDGTLEVVRRLLLGGKLLGLAFLVGVIAAIYLDRGRLAEISTRDHLFPSDGVQGSQVTLPDDEDPLRALLASRYRRLRNGVHTTIDATTQQWPPRCESHPAPIAELARLGRAADVAVGPGTSSSGWAPDPEAPEGSRFVGPGGFTAYVAGTTIVEPVLVSTPTFDPETTDLETQARLTLEAEEEAARITSAAPTTTSISTPKARLEAKGFPLKEAGSDYWQYIAVGAFGVGLYVIVRLLTIGEAPTETFDAVIGLPDAPNSPALIVGVLGAIAAGVSLRGRDVPVLGAGSTVGPGYDPSPDRPDECEA